jgi:uncharacterized protein YodC (DUF2158 family)
MRGSGRTREMVMALPEGGATVVVHVERMRRYVRDMIRDLRGAYTAGRTRIDVVASLPDAVQLYNAPQPIYLDHAFEELLPALARELRRNGGALGLGGYAPPYSYATMWQQDWSTLTVGEVTPSGPALDGMQDALAAACRRMMDAYAEAYASPVMIGVDLGGPDATAVTYRGVPIRQIHTDLRPGGLSYIGNAPAAEKARKLLREWLSPAQRASFDAHAHFEVTGSASGKRYRINKGTAINVDELAADGTVACKWCFGPPGLAAGDVMLAQKIALETDEKAAMKVANRHDMVPLCSRGPEMTVTEVIAREYEFYRRCNVAIDGVT